MVTLWRVQDRSASEFMQAFYRALRSGVTPAEALRIVRQRWLAGSGDAGQPSRWAPFVLVGGVGQE
jgi:CHAT domain-containing protein